ncbi:hypothetical protein BDZ45DRAFT_734399 [Acephala macrosclerotiorum]|nr:hypothetical protein BDZ45DRAFT_734399 [Acephala macrosclerotiorum]
MSSQNTVQVDWVSSHRPRAQGQNPPHRQSTPQHEWTQCFNNLSACIIRRSLHSRRANGANAVVATIPSRRLEPRYRIADPWNPLQPTQHQSRNGPMQGCTTERASLMWIYPMRWHEAVFLSRETCAHRHSTCMGLTRKIKVMEEFFSSLTSINFLLTTLWYIFGPRNYRVPKYSPDLGSGKEWYDFPNIGSDWKIRPVRSTSVRLTSNGKSAAESRTTVRNAAMLVAWQPLDLRKIPLLGYGDTSARRVDAFDSDNVVIRLVPSNVHTTIQKITIILSRIGAITMQFAN